MHTTTTTTIACFQATTCKMLSLLFKSSWDWSDFLRDTAVIFSL